MTWPALMPEEFDSLRNLPRDQQLVSALTSQSAFVVISFFRSAIEDETWTLQNEQFVSELLKWLVREFVEYRISEFEGEQVVQGYYLHRAILEPMLPQDLSIHVDQKQILASSLLYGWHSPILRSAIHSQYSPDHPSNLEAGEISLKVFLYLHEFVSTGDLASLWREPLEILLQVLRQASDWEMMALQTRCIELISRYVLPDNIVTTLLYAQQYGIRRLRAELLSKLNEMQLGVTWESEEPNELAAVIQEYHERGRQILQNLAPHLTRLSFRGDTALDPFIQTLLPLAAQLRWLDLDHTSGCHEDLLDLISPQIEALSLHNCAWLTQHWTRKAIAAMPHIQKLYIGDNADMGGQIFISLLEIPHLDELNVRNLAVVNDNNFSYLYGQQTELQRLDLSWCTGLTETVLSSLRGRKLQVLDLSHTKIADAGLQAIAKACPLLQQVSVEDCPSLTEEGVLVFVRQALNMRRLNARGLGLSPSACSEIRKIRKGVELAV